MSADYFFQLNARSTVSSEQAAVMLVDGQQLSYAQLQQQVSSAAEVLKSAVAVPRPLVFLRATNNLNTLITYLACLQQDMPLLLLAEETLPDALQRLTACYEPNLVINAGSDNEIILGEAIHKTSDREHRLHTDLSLLLTTSGSTGSPKLVRLSRQNLQANAESICQFLPIKNSDTAITSLPFCYSYGLSIINTHLLRRARLALCEQGVQQREFWELFRRAEVNSFAGVPLSYSALQQMRFERGDYPSLRYLTQAGGALSSSQWQYLCLLSEQWQLPVYAMYGQTEATARIAFLPPEDFAHQPHCIGRAIPGGELSLCDTNGQSISAESHQGELIYRGANVMMGYAEGLDDLSLGSNLASLATGDIAERQGEYFYIKGRLKRFIKLAGVRVNLDDLETNTPWPELMMRALGEDDQLLLAIECPASDGGESCTALQSTDLDLPGMQREIAERLSVNPRYITIKVFKSLPLLASGKPDYPALGRAFDAAA